MRTDSSIFSTTPLDKVTVNRSQKCEIVDKSEI